MIQNQFLIQTPAQDQEKKIKLMMVDDHHSARQAYAAFLNEEKNLEVIAQAGNGLELMQHLQANSEHPDIIILDIEMPVMSGKEALPLIKKLYPDLKVIILSMIDEHGYITDMLLRGAAGYLPKRCDLDTIVDTINAVYTDGFHFDPSVSQSLVSALMAEKSTAPIFKQLLSEREMEVLKLLCMGKTKGRVAESLFTSTETVKSHVKNIYRKLSVDSTIALVKYAIKNGLIELD